MERDEWINRFGDGWINWMDRIDRRERWMQTYIFLTRTPLDDL